MIQTKQAFKEIKLNENSLSLSQITFVRSLKKHYARNKQLSEKQQKILFEIKKYMSFENTIKI